MHSRDLKQAILILQKAGLKVDENPEESENLIEFTLKNLENIKKTRNPIRYLEEKIKYLETLYGENIWNQYNSSDPLMMLDSCKAGILKAIKEEIGSASKKKSS